MARDPYVLNEIQNFLLAEADRIEAVFDALGRGDVPPPHVLPPLPGDISYSSFAVNLRHWARQGAEPNGAGLRQRNCS